MTPAEYDAWYDSPRGRWIGETEWRAICRRLDLTPGTTLLDVGCGTGWSTENLARMGAEVSAIDLTEKAVELTKRRFALYGMAGDIRVGDTEALDYARTHSPQNVSYLAGDGRSLPFTDRSFEQTVAITSLCFIDDWPRAIGEIVRVTRSRFVLGLLNRRSLLWRRKGRDGGTGGYAGAHWHTRRELAPVFAGLKVRQVRIQTAVFIPTGTTVARLVESFLPAWLPWGALLIVSGEVT